LLGNAYLALFFSKMETTKLITQAFQAYINAEKDTTEAKNNPDLHFNRATVHEYMEEYDKAVEGYRRAWISPF
jgi:Tfp pilus assembly protein PilF